MLHACAGKGDPSCARGKHFMKDATSQDQSSSAHGTRMFGARALLWPWQKRARSRVFAACCIAYSLTKCAPCPLLLVCAQVCFASTMNAAAAVATTSYSRVSMIWTTSIFWKRSCASHSLFSRGCACARIQRQRASCRCMARVALATSRSLAWLSSVFLSCNGLPDSVDCSMHSL